MKIGRKLKTAGITVAVVVAAAVPVALATQGGAIDELDRIGTASSEHDMDSGREVDFGTDAESGFSDDDFGGDDFDFGGDFDESELDSAAEVAELNAMTDELAAFLTERGVQHTVESTETRWVEWDFNDEAANQAVEEFFQQYESQLEQEYLDSLTDEDIAEIKAEADAWKAALDEAGISYTLETDELGIEWPLFDENDAAAWEAIDKLYEDMDSDDMDSDDMDSDEGIDEDGS